MQRRRCVTRTGIFLIFFAIDFIIMSYLNMIFFVCEGQFMKILGLTFSGDQEKKSRKIFSFWNVKGVTQGDLTYLEFLKVK